MQAEEHTVGEPAQLQDIFADTAGALHFARSLHRLEIRRGLTDGDLTDEAVRHIKSVFKRPVVVLQPHVQIDKNRLVPKCAQRLADCGARDQRDVALSTDAAAQYNNFHAGMIPFPF